MRLPLIFSLVVVHLTLGKAHADADPFKEPVRSTAPLSPQEQQKTFHLPPGFEIQLVASEPGIAKPMNIAFDARGRLWVTETRQYPFPATAPSGGRDSIKILEDADGDGRAEKITTFADGLNIPIGLYPYGDGVIAFSIPQVSYYRDTNGDGRADRVEPLYGTFGSRDTHGMTNGFRRGLDGWIYACHGFNNESKLKGKDGVVTTLKSGNTYRMKVDGSHLEQFAFGQTNPFGMTIDPAGNVYSSDGAHAVYYQLLRGGYYSGLGKTDGGLGFAPPLMNHTHGDASPGVLFYAADAFPAEFRGNMFQGDALIGRIHRDSLAQNGSTPVANHLDDFLVSDDPWTRPVDMQLAPDGSIYVADFYNAIIGHYEVPLDHPKRDHERGRIWRIVYTGEGAKKSFAKFDFAAAGAEQLIAKLDDRNLANRMLAMDQLSDRIGQAAVQPIVELLQRKPMSLQKIHGLWVLHRLQALPPELLAAAASDIDSSVRAQAMKMIAETPDATAGQNHIAAKGLSDSDPFTQRCAAEALGRHPRVKNVRPLLDLLHAVPAGDTHLRYVARIALRDQLRDPKHLAAVVETLTLSPADMQSIAEICLAIETPEAGAFVLAHIDEASPDKPTVLKNVRTAAANVPDASLDRLANFAQNRFVDDLEFQLDLFQAVAEAVAQRGAVPTGATATWGKKLVTTVFSPGEDLSHGWKNEPLAGASITDNPWVLQIRKSRDGDVASTFLSSLPLGEHLTGVLRSPPFAIPPSLSMYVAGQNGPPGTQPPPKNLLRVRDAATGEILREDPPPRRDTGQKMTWDLQSYAGRKGYLEIVDGDDSPGWAWLAFGRLDPPVVPLPAISLGAGSRRTRIAAEIAGTLHLAEFADALKRLSSDRDVEADVRIAAATALASIDAASAAPILAGILGDAPRALQTRVAQVLAGTGEGASVLLDAVAAGKASARLLQEQAIKDRLAALRSNDIDDQVKTLTKNLPPQKEQVQQQITSRIVSFKSAKPSAQRGQQVFAKNCLVCHRIEGAGALIGPQLDAIAARGVERVIEDILDPSRNVDPSFRYLTIILKDNTLITGLPRREEGDTAVFVDTTGKEVAVPKTQIKQRIPSSASLMPDNFADAISPQDFNDLLAYLLAPHVAK
jgi:putative heme-binding domain-containing protein